MSYNPCREVDSASVKVMRSYDYCHFEVTLGINDDCFLNDVDELRKDAMRLVDKAVEQYKIAKAEANLSWRHSGDLGALRRQVQAIKENFPKSEWSEEQKAKVKELEDAEYRASRAYDYEDDWEYWESELEPPF